MNPYGQRRTVTYVRFGWSTMKEITSLLGVPDVFWAAGDSVFFRTTERPPRGAIRNFMQGMADARGNLKYHLLTQRRLVLPDTSLLLTPPVVKLFVGDGRAEFAQFIEDGSVVPLLRTTVTGFRELAEQLRRGENYRELSDRTIVRYANRLDSHCRDIARLPGDYAPALMDDLGSEVLRHPSYWTGEVDTSLPTDRAKSFVSQVEQRMLDRGVTRFRQTEFWETAEEIERGGDRRLAQSIRVEASIHSLGAMARVLELPMSIPAPSTAKAGRVYSTEVPIRITDGALELDSRSFDNPVEIATTVFDIASRLSAADVSRVRDSEQFRAFISATERAEIKGSAALRHEALVRYSHWLTGWSAAVSLGEERYLDRLSWVTRAATVGHRLHSAEAIGSVSLHSLRGAGAELPHLIEVAGTLVGVAMFAAGVDRAYERVLTRYQKVQRQLRINSPTKIQFFGPADERHWWLFRREG